MKPNVNYEKLSKVLAEGISKAIVGKHDIIVEGERFSKQEIDALIAEQVASFIDSMIMESVECQSCDGLGYTYCPACGEHGMEERKSDCEKCNGVGSVKCPDCDEDGYLKEMKTAPDGSPIIELEQEGFDLRNAGFPSAQEEEAEVTAPDGSVLPRSLHELKAVWEQDKNLMIENFREIMNNAVNDIDGITIGTVFSKKKGYPIGHDITDLLNLHPTERPHIITINDEKFECVKTSDDTDRERSTKGYLVYDSYANLLGKFNHVRSYEELEYLIEKRLSDLEHQAPKSHEDMELIRRRHIENSFVENPYLNESDMLSERLAKKTN